MYLPIDVVNEIVYKRPRARDKRCDGQAGDEPDIPSKLSNPTKPRRACQVRAEDDSESTCTAAGAKTIRRKKQ